MPPPSLLINGYRHSFASLELGIGSFTTKDFAELNYSDNAEKTDVRGAGRVVKGFTAGDYKAEGSVGIYKWADDALIHELGNGFLDVWFPITVNYAERNTPLISDLLFACSFKSGAHTLSKGNDGIIVKRDLTIVGIRWNGVWPIQELADLAGV